MSAISSNTTRLNAAITTLKHLETSFRSFQDQSETKFQLLYNENKLLKAEIERLKAETREIGERNSRVEEKVGIVYVDNPADEMGEAEQVDDEDVTGSVRGVSREEDEAWRANNAALKSKAFRVCIFLHSYHFIGQVNVFSVGYNDRQLQDPDGHEKTRWE